MPKSATTGKPRAKRDSDRYATPADIRGLLLWARQKGFRIRELEADGVRLVLDDLRIHDGAAQPDTKTPRNAHEAFAAQFGIDIPEDEEADLL